MYIDLVVFILYPIKILNYLNMIFKKIIINVIEYLNRI